jgi:hypothetical protein
MSSTVAVAEYSVHGTWRSYSIYELNNMRQPKAHAYRSITDQETLMRVTPTVITSSSELLILGVNSMVRLETPSLVWMTIISMTTLQTVMTGCKSWITPLTPPAFLPRSLLSWSRRICGMCTVQAVILPVNSPRRTSIATRASRPYVFHNWTPHLNCTEPRSKRFTFNKGSFGSRNWIHSNNYNLDID